MVIVVGDCNAKVGDGEESPYGKTKNMMDFVLVSKRWKVVNISSCRSFSKQDIASDMCVFMPSPWWTSTVWWVWETVSAAWLMPLSDSVSSCRELHQWEQCIGTFPSLFFHYFFLHSSRLKVYPRTGSLMTVRQISPHSTAIINAFSTCIAFLLVLLLL